MTDQQETKCFKLENLDPDDARFVQMAEAQSELYHKSILPLFLENKGVLIVSSISGIFGKSAPHAPFPNEVRLFFQDVNGNAKAAVYVLSHKPVELEIKDSKKVIC
jgi:hypothetical protein